MPEHVGISVECKKVTYRLNGRRLVSDLNFSVRSGETLVLLGRSGSGKTTTLKLMNRLLEPSDGEVLVQGVPTTRWDRIRLRRSIGYVIQEVGLFPHFSVERNIALVPSLEGWERERIRERVRQLMEIIGLDPGQFAARFPHELSGGQRQRVGVARALAADPPILLMDEPFGSLDPITRLEIRQEFRRLKDRLGKTVIFVTHDVQEAFALASRIGLMKEGRLVEIDTPDEFLQSKESEALAFIQCLQANGQPYHPQRGTVS